MRKYKVALVIINQIRNKVGIVYGSNETPAAGGKALDYYLGVNMKTVSNKTSDLLKDDNKKVIGIQGRLRNTKNKVSIPFRETTFKLMFDEGLDPFEGVVDCLLEDGLVTRSGAWYTVVSSGEKFQRKELENIQIDPKFEEIRKELGLE